LLVSKDGWFSPPLPVQSFVFELSDSCKQKFRKLQQHLATTSKPDQYIFTASYGLSNMTPDLYSFRQWIDLQLSADEGFLPLIDGAVMEVTPTVTK